jgi:hypothetical protein
MITEFFLRFEVLMAVTMTITVLWNMTSCSRVEVYRRFRWKAASIFRTEVVRIQGQLRLALREPTEVKRTVGRGGMDRFARVEAVEIRALWGGYPYLPLVYFRLLFRPFILLQDGPALQGPQISSPYSYWFAKGPYPSLHIHATFFNFRLTLSSWVWQLRVTPKRR